MGYGLSEAWMTKTLQTVLGHSSAKVTLDVYAELWSDRQKDQTRRWRRLRPRSRADATSTWRNDDDGSQETNGPHDPEGHRRTGAEGAAGRPVRADPTATHRRGDDLPPVRRVPFPHKGFACTRRCRPDPLRYGGGVDYWQSMSKGGVENGVPIGRRGDCMAHRIRIRDIKGGSRHGKGMRRPLRTAIAVIVATAMLTPTIASAAPVVPDAPSPVPGVESSSPYADDGVTYTADGRPLYESASDTIYIYNALQTAVSRQDDAADQPVLTGDGDAETFGTGQPVYAEDSDEPLTYSPEHTYVYVDGWDEGLEDAGENNNVVVSDEPEDQEESDAEKDEPVEKNDAAGKDVVETEPTEDSAEKSTESDEVDLLADGGETEAYNSLSGRDYVGQVTKQIGDETYILIGNEQQLRAIGSNDPVIGGPVYQIEQYWHIGLNSEWRDVEGEKPTLVYPGDADLSAGQSLRGKSMPDDGGGRTIITHHTYKYFTYDDSGNRNDTVEDNSRINTGLTYSSDANYIIFRNIALSDSEWTPLMFSGVMLGAVSKTPSQKSSLFTALGQGGQDCDISAVNRPVISNVFVNHTSSELNASEFVGFGFFGTISNKLDDSNPFSTPKQSVVRNISLDGPTVYNNATAVTVDETLVSGLLSVVGALGEVISWLLSILTFGKLDLRGLLWNLLDVRKGDPSSLATGAFVGRVVGDVVVDNCEVTNARVANTSDQTGGFVGYATGETQYQPIPGYIVDLLTNLLNIIPGLGLGDLITLLLNSNILKLTELIPIGYLNPQISNCTVDGLTGRDGRATVGEATTSFTGGFVGNQVGTIITGCVVEGASAVTLQGKYYVGGFAGAMRNGEMDGLLSQLEIEVVRVTLPQSITMDSSVEANVTVRSVSYAGGFVGAMANSFAVNDALSGVISVKTDLVQNDADGNRLANDHAGGFAGVASVGWATDLGSDDATEDASLLTSLVNIVKGLLGDSSKTSNLLTLMGVQPSAILGIKMSGTITVHSDGAYAGGVVGSGEGAIIAASDSEHLQKLSFWKYRDEGDTLFADPTPEKVRVNQVEGLASVTAKGNYVGGIAGELHPAAVAGLLNDTLGIGSIPNPEDRPDLSQLGEQTFSMFEVSDTTVAGAAGGYTVASGVNADGSRTGEDGWYAGGAIGLTSGGNISNVTLSEVKHVEATGEVGGFIGFSGPGELAGSDGLNLLGLVKVSNLLNVAQYSALEVEDACVQGIAEGFTVEATGKASDGETKTFTAGGFYGQVNSSETRDCHVYGIKSVTADKNGVEGGVAGGFVGYSTTGGLAEALGDEDDSSALIDSGLINLNGLLGAVPYLIPTYRKTDVAFVNNGYVKADVAGGFAGNFQSGEVNQFSEKDLEEDPSLAQLKTDVEKSPYAVINLARVEGGAYAGGFGGIVEAGSLANAADGGLSILGGLIDDASVADLTNLLGLIQAYVPYINYAGVHTDGTTSKQGENANYGLKVTADRIDSTDLNAGSAGGFIGYGAAVQVSHSSVDQLVNTKVTEPSDLEGTDGSSYFDQAQSDYAVSAPRYAGGYIGYMDIGDTAGAVDGLSVLEGTGLKIDLSNVLSALNVVSSMIEHSDVYGAAGGYAVLARGKDDQTGTIGHAGGYAGLIAGGHTQNSNAYNFSHIIGQVCAGGYAGELEPGSVAKVLDSADVGEGGLLDGLIDANGLVSLVNAFVPSVRNSVTTSIPCGGVVRAQAASGEESASGNETIATQRGMAGGFVGHNEGGQIEGNNRDKWKDTDGNYILDDYAGPIQPVEAIRIRSVYGAEYAGGFTGLMESASTAKAGSLSLLWGLVKANNLLGALKAIYPTEDNTAVWGPLRKLTVEEWNNWVDFVGVNGGYGSSLASEGKISADTDDSAAQAKLDELIDSYAYGTAVVAGRSTFEQSAVAADGGAAGGYVGSMVTGVITNGQAHDTKLVRAMRAAGGFAGSAVTGGAASLGGDSLLGLDLNPDQLLGAAQVFVPTIKNSSVVGYRMGMTVTSFGAPAEGDDSQHETDIKRGTGNAGGYIGYGSGVQIWGDEKGGTNDGTTELEGIGCTVSGLRRVTASAYAGGFAGKLTSGAMANVSTNVSDGFLQSLLDSLVNTTGINNLVQVLQASMSTVRRASVSAHNEEYDTGDASWGYTVEGYTADGVTAYPIAAGGFAGMVEATVLGELGLADGSQERPELPVVEEDGVSVAGVRGVEGEYYAGGLVGLADVGGLAEVAGDDTEGAGVSILGLIGLGDVTALEVFQPCIYAAHVTGVEDGLTVRARTADAGGLFGNARRSGNAGGFVGSIMSGTIRSSSLENLSSVSGPSYTGGFVGYTGKSGVLDADDVNVVQGLLGVSASAINTFSTLIEDSTVTGIAGGYTVASTGTDYATGDTTNANKMAGGFVGFADLAHIDNCDASALKRVSSGEIAGGFAGKGTYAYLVSLDAESPLVQILLAVVSALVQELWIKDLQGENVIDVNLGDEVLHLTVFGDGNTVSLTLLGIDVKLTLNKDEDAQTGTVVLKIGDSSVELKVDKEGNISNDNEMSNVAVNLIKGNSAKITNCTVTGIAQGYDVFGGAATQDPKPAEGTEATVAKASNQATGYAGGFIGLNEEAQVTGNKMVYADVVKGANDKTGPFTGATSYQSNWWFNSVDNIDKDNTYHVYRSEELVGKNVTGTSGTMTVSAAASDPVGWARFDVTGHTPHTDSDGNAQLTSNLSDWNGATVDGSDIGVFASAGKAVLMDDVAVTDNTGGLTPEPGDGQDPCEASVDLTLQKVWNDGLLGIFSRPNSISVRIRATYGNVAKYVRQDERTGAYDLVGAVEGQPVPTITLTADEDGSPWSETWRKVIDGLPVAIEGKDGAPQYVTYTVEELTVDGYVTTITSDATEKVITITNTKQGLLPGTGGTGTHWFALLGILLVGVGILLTRKDTYGRGTGRHRAAR